MISYLEFEKPVAALEAQIKELETTASEGELDIESDIERLRKKADRLLRSIYASLTPWQKTQVARHPSRPHFKDYISYIFTDFVELGGDRAFADDKAILGGFAKIDGRKVMVIGHEKGNDTQSRIKHNFGMGKPEGYRKAIRLMELASRFGLPVITLVDTSGAFPGIQAEERGQAEAIARSTEACLRLQVPMVACVVGEGGSGGAIALAAAEKLLMFEHAVYSVISPEGCASILWRTSDRAADAAEAMQVSAQQLHALGVVDQIIDEPLGGAHRAPGKACESLKTAILQTLDSLASMLPEQIIAMREERYMKLGR